MTISGGIKILKKNKGLYKDGTTITATSNNSSASNMIDISKYTEWRSSGSDDTTVEQIIVTFPKYKTINRIMMLDHNLKDYGVAWWDGSAYVAFTSVIGLDGSQSFVIETSFSDSSSYYEFDSVNTPKIRINCNKTQVADAEKYISTLIFTEELGTFAGFPVVSNYSLSSNETIQKTLSHKAKVFKSFQTVGFSLGFKTYPSESDLTLLETLLNSVDPFLVWLCGGYRGTAYFQKKTIQGFNLEDAYQMQTVGSFNPSYTANIYINGVDQTFNLIESV